MKRIKSVLLLSCVLLLSFVSFSQTRSVPASVQTYYTLPNSVPAGVLNIHAKFTYYFEKVREAGKFHMMLRINTVAEPANPNGEYYYRYKDKSFSHNQLSQEDGLEMTGFSQIQLKELKVEIFVGTGQDTRTKTILFDTGIGHATLWEVNEKEDPSKYYLQFLDLKHVYVRNDEVAKKRVQNYLTVHENREKFKNYIDKANASYNAKNYPDAKLNYQHALALFPNDQYAKDQLQKIQDEEDKRKNDKTFVNKKPSELAGEKTGNDENETNGKNSSRNNVKNSSVGSNDQKSVNASSTVTNNVNKTVSSINSNSKSDASAATAKPPVSYEELISEADRKRLAKEAKIAEESAKIQRSIDYAATSFYLSNQVDDAKSNIKQSGRLSGNYTSIDELEAEYNQKMQSINSSVEQLRTANNEQLMHNYNAMVTSQPNTKMQTAGAIITGLAYIANEAQAKREKEAAEAKLQQQKKEAEEAIEKKRMALVSDLRKKCLAEFSDGGIPYDQPGYKEVYFFVFSYDPNEIAAKSAVVKISNVFPLCNYGDGSWPMKSSVLHGIKKITNGGEVTLMGYYRSQQEAEETRSALIRLATKSEFTKQDIYVKGKSTSGSELSQIDFWGNPLKK